MKNEKLFTIISLTFIVLISSCRTYHYIPESEPYKFANINSIDGDTVALVTIQNNKLNGKAKILKKYGKNRGGIFDIIYQDAIYYDKWVYGNYTNNKKSGKWYSLDDEEKITLEYTYRNDTLDGDFFEYDRSNEMNEAENNEANKKLFFRKSKRTSIRN